MRMNEPERPKQTRQNTRKKKEEEEDDDVKSMFETTVTFFAPVSYTHLTLPTS